MRSPNDIVSPSLLVEVASDGRGTGARLYRLASLDVPQHLHNLIVEGRRCNRAASSGVSWCGTELAASEEGLLEAAKWSLIFLCHGPAVQSTSRMWGSTKQQRDTTHRWRCIRRLARSTSSSTHATAQVSEGRVGGSRFPRMSFASARSWSSASPFIQAPW